MSRPKGCAPTGSIIARSGSCNRISCRREIAVAFSLGYDRASTPLLGMEVDSKFANEVVQVCSAQALTDVRPQIAGS